MGAEGGGPAAVVGRGLAALSVVVWRHLPDTEAVQHRRKLSSDFDRFEGVAK